MLAKAECTAADVVLANSMDELAQVTVMGIRRTAAEAGEDSMTQQAVASFVMVDPSIALHELDRVDLWLSVEVHVVPGDMLLAAMLQ